MVRSNQLNNWLCSNICASDRIQTSNKPILLNWHAMYVLQIYNTANTFPSTPILMQTWIHFVLVLFFNLTFFFNWLCFTFKLITLQYIISTYFVLSLLEFLGANFMWICSIILQNVNKKWKTQKKGKRFWRSKKNEDTLCLPKSKII